MQLPTVGFPTPDINIVRATPEYYVEKIRLLGLVIEHQRDDTVVSPLHVHRERAHSDEMVREAKETDLQSSYMQIMSGIHFLQKT